MTSPSYALGLQPRCYALVPAAGAGARSGAAIPKQYVSLAGKAMMAHTLAALARVPQLEATLVVLSPQDDQFEAAVPEFQGERAWVARVGGESRAASVAQGLDELLARGAQAHDWVLVHDAARCLLRPEWVQRLIETCWDDEVGGLLALPVADTLKSSAGGRVQATVDRREKWAAQTPQMFRLGLLRPALAQLGEAITDESSAVEALGHSPLLVESPMENFKVTWPADFALAEALLKSRG
ncbi:2-C-methyl-D-erythritol 4-phosphate cytidylyltransferase [Paucibacter oligotrophus]|uniref:2-C-methyl-D-erythritol 4-phosphate cytidylyltransferase n=1 Tax=Roseateles oligotrophus TaxID=1769250 RepID=A0A840L116_9BURK|nr:2-C-methyl-D-erythritol 4-phosphate cytidylyltransferase [Roseateles oligotrophus]MBB4841940.1 2-C-methyl-D-erythritol 4-phosphate cytidylyltransferase [Roseateles oligotrophus]